MADHSSACRVLLEDVADAQAKPRQHVAAVEVVVLADLAGLGAGRVDPDRAPSRPEDPDQGDAERLVERDLLVDLLGPTGTLWVRRNDLHDQIGRDLEWPAERLAGRQAFGSDERRVGSQAAVGVATVDV